MSTQMRDAKPVIVVGLAAMAFVLAAVGATVATKFGVLPPGAAKRIGMISMGLVLVVAGNFIPKMRFFERQGFPPSRALAAQRFSGWTLVMAGLAVAGFWIFSATRETLLASSLVGLGAFALMGAAWGWLLLGPRATATTEDGDGAVASASRQALVWILFGFFWAFAMFLSDYLWGDDISVWVAIAFSVTIMLATFISAIMRVRRLKKGR